MPEIQRERVGAEGDYVADVETEENATQDATIGAWYIPKGLRTLLAAAVAMGGVALANLPSADAQTRNQPAWNFGTQNTPGDKDSKEYIAFTKSVMIEWWKTNEGNIIGEAKKLQRQRDGGTTPKIVVPGTKIEFTFPITPLPTKCLEVYKSARLDIIFLGKTADNRPQYRAQFVVTEKNNNDQDYGFRIITLTPEVPSPKNTAPEPKAPPAPKRIPGKGGIDA